MIRALTLVCLLGAAPMQCASDPTTTVHDDDVDDAPEALWNLAERLRVEGNLEARRTALDQLRRDYPSSRFAVRAERELAGTAP